MPEDPDGKGQGEADGSKDGRLIAWKRIKTWWLSAAPHPLLGRHPILFVVSTLGFIGYGLIGTPLSDAGSVISNLILQSVRLWDVFIPDELQALFNRYRGLREIVVILAVVSALYVRTHGLIFTWKQKIKPAVSGIWTGLVVPLSKAAGAGGLRLVSAIVGSFKKIDWKGVFEGIISEGLFWLLVKAGAFVTAVYFAQDWLINLMQTIWRVIF